MTSPSNCNGGKEFSPQPQRVRLLIGAALGLFCAAIGTGVFFACGDVRLLQQTPTLETLAPRDTDRKGGTYLHLYTPDGTLLIAASFRVGGDNLLSVWDLAQKRIVHSATLPRGGARAMSISARGDILAIAIGLPLATSAKGVKDDGKPREVRLYSLPELKQVGKIESQNYIASVVLSPDGKLLAAMRHIDGTRDWELVVWDALSFKPKYTLTEFLPGHTATKTVVSFSPDGKKLAHTRHGLARIPGVKQGPVWERAPIREYEAETGKPMGVISSVRNPPGGLPLEDFEYFPDGKALLIKWVDSIWAYDFATGHFRSLYARDRKTVWKIQHAMISADGKWLVMGTDERYLRGAPPKTPQIVIWDLEANRLHGQWPLTKIGESIDRMALSPDKKTIAIGADGGLFLFHVPAK